MAKRYISVNEAIMTLYDMPSEVRKEHYEKCRKCKIRKGIAQLVDIHIDYIDCPYDCENDLEHLVNEAQE